MNIKIKDKKLHAILTKKEELINLGSGIQKEIENKQKELHKLGLKVQKVKDKAIPLMQKHVDEMYESGKLKEFEVVGSFKVEKDQLIADIIDVEKQFHDIMVARVNEMKTYETSKSNNKTEKKPS